MNVTFSSKLKDLVSENDSRGYQSDAELRKKYDFIKDGLFNIFIDGVNIKIQDTFALII